MCRDFLVTPLEARVLKVDFSNLQGIFITINSCVGIFLAPFWKNKMAAIGVFRLSARSFVGPLEQRAL